MTVGGDEVVKRTLKAGSAVGAAFGQLEYLCESSRVRSHLVGE